MVCSSALGFYWSAWECCEHLERAEQIDEDEPFGGDRDLRPARFMIRMLKSIAKFVIVLVVMTVIFSMIWGELITDRLYNCTDAVGFDYLQPGNWVHGQVAFVGHVLAGRSMSEPDIIKEGWSAAGLWGLWLSFFILSLVASVLLARKAWVPRGSAGPDTAQNVGPTTPVGTSERSAFPTP